jgi:hypothetical protein
MEKFWENFETTLCVAACAAVSLVLLGGVLVGLAFLARFQGGF